MANQPLDEPAAMPIKKTVSFQETTTIVRFPDMGGEPSWHTMEDRKAFILQARMETNAWINKGRYGFLLQDSFFDSSEASVQEKMDAYAQLPGEDYCRGLERHVCREHGLKRDGFKKGAIRAIVNEGRKRKERGMPIEQAWMQLGEISRHLSAQATRFARRVGAADELVVKEGEDASKVLKLHEEAMQDAMEKMGTITPNCPASQEEASPTRIAVGGEDSKQQERSNSPLSVTTFNGWCHGSRESCIQPPPPQVPSLD